MESNHPYKLQEYFYPLHVTIYFTTYEKYLADGKVGKRNMDRKINKAINCHFPHLTIGFWIFLLPNQLNFNR